MVKFLKAVFGCSHTRTTFPMTSTPKVGPKRTYVVCLKCGREFDYDWDSMSMVKGSDSYTMQHRVLSGSRTPQ